MTDKKTRLFKKVTKNIVALSIENDGKDYLYVRVKRDSYSSRMQKYYSFTSLSGFRNAVRNAFSKLGKDRVYEEEITGDVLTKEDIEKIKSLNVDWTDE